MLAWIVYAGINDSHPALGDSIQYCTLPPLHPWRAFIDEDPQGSERVELDVPGGIHQAWQKRVNKLSDQCFQIPRAPNPKHLNRTRKYLQSSLNSLRLRSCVNPNIPNDTVTK